MSEISQSQMFIDQYSIYRIKISHWRILIRVVSFIYFCFLTLMLLHPDPWTLLGWAPTTRLEKEVFSYIHVAIFLFLAFNISFCDKRKHNGIWLVLLLLYGPITEILQVYTGRSFSWLDIFQDTLGMSIGFAAGFMLRSYIKQRVIKEHKSDEIR